MKTAQYLTNLRLVLEDSVANDSAILIEDGKIVAIEPCSGTSRADVELIDLKGQTVLPGLIDLHCDAIEKEVEPRARVLFPIPFAVAQVDRRNAAAGITTPFHAVSFANKEYGVRNNQTACEVIRVLKEPDATRLVDNRVHCRYEVTDPTALPLLCELIAKGLVDMVSVMDHSPGQGQFKTLEAYVDYMMGNHAMDRQGALLAAHEKSKEQEGVPQRINDLLAMARRYHVATASHDDDSPQRIGLMRELGVQMSEFPINLETAAAAINAGLPTIFGAPNVLRGGSQSGSMKAVDAVLAGTASCLCSDYQPSTLAPAAFALAKAEVIPLHEAVNFISAHPAKAVGLHDRGRIAPGLRADLIAVSVGNKEPLVTRTWCAGKLVFFAGHAFNPS